MNIKLKAVNEKSRDACKVRTKTDSPEAGLIQQLMRMSRADDHGLKGKSKGFL